MKNASVVLGMPVHNGARTLRKVLDAIRCQTFTDYHLSILDDASTDDSWQQLQALTCGDERITCRRAEYRLGLVDAWRQVAREAIDGHDAEYFAWVSDHDLVEPTWLADLHEAMRSEPGTVLAYGRTHYVHDLDDLGNVWSEGPRVDTRGGDMYDRLTRLPLTKSFAGDMIYGLIRVDALRKVNVFPVAILPDRLVVLSLAMLGDIVHVDTAVRHRLVPAEPESIAKPLAKQLMTLFRDDNRPALPYWNNATYFLQPLFDRSCADGAFGEASLQFYLGLQHAQYMLENCRDELRHEIEFMRRANDWSSGLGLYYFVRACLEDDWRVMYVSAEKLKKKLEITRAELARAQRRDPTPVAGATAHLAREQAPVVGTRGPVSMPLLPHNGRHPVAPGAPRLVDIVICTYNRSRFLKICLEALLPQIGTALQGRVGVFVVDNNCTDDTAQTVEMFLEAHPYLVRVQEPKQGLSNARNRGATESRAEYLCYLDDDAKPGPVYVRTLLGILEWDRPDFAGGPILPFYLTPKPDWFEDSFEIRRHSDRTGFVDCPVSGGNFVVQRRLLHELGMFDPELGMVGDTVRLGEERAVIERYREQRSPAARRIYYSQELFVYHYVPPSKMRVGYLLHRAFQSGRSSVIVKKERRRALPRLCSAVARQCVRLGWSTIARHPVSERIAIARRGAMLLGKIRQHLASR